MTAFIVLHFINAIQVFVLVFIAAVVAGVAAAFATEYSDEGHDFISIVQTQLIELQVQIILRLCKHRFVSSFPLMLFYSSFEFQTEYTQHTPYITQ